MRTSTRLALAVVVVAVVRDVTERSRSAGTRGDEATRPLPGDAAAAGVRSVSTRAIAIAAPPAAVLPWLVQMGHRRGGWSMRR